MSTLRSSILSRLVAALQGDGVRARPAGVPAPQTGWGLSLTADQLPSLVVRYRSEEVGAVGGSRGPLVKRTLVIAVEVRVADSVTETAQDVADPILEWVSSSIKAVDVVTPTRVAHVLTEGTTTWEADSDGETPVLLATVEVVADYQSSADSASAWA